MVSGRVLIGFDDTPLTVSPTWTSIDLTHPNLVAGIGIYRGRQLETEYTGTSTATVYLNDTEGLFDPANTGSPYYNKIDGKPIQLQLWNPVAAEWVIQTRMTIDNWTYDFDPATNAAGELLIANIALECVDLFDYLAGVPMIPLDFGDPLPPAIPAGCVWYPEETFQERIEHILDDSGIPSALYVVFEGSTVMQDMPYDQSDTALVGIRDALDGDFPGIANGYTDKTGRVVAHGKFARFDPSAVAPTGDWDFHRWKAGDGVAIALEDERAQIRPPLRWARPRSRIVNIAWCWPKGIAEADIPGQTVRDDTSIDDNGYRPWSAENLIVLHDNYTGLDGDAYCQLIAEWKVANYKDPRTVVEALTFRSIDPQTAADHSSAAWKRAQRSWALLCGQDISDTIQLEHGYPGGVGISEQFYIEGSVMEIRPLNPSYDDVTLTVNVSPESDYASDPFTPS